MFTKRKKLILFALIIMSIMFFIIYIYRSKVNQMFLKNADVEHITNYENGDYLYSPDVENISYDEEEAALYYNNMIKVYLLSEINNKEMTQLANIVNGNVVGKISGSINFIQILTDESDLQELNKKIDILMESEDVLYACYDYPIDISDMTIDENTWEGEENEGYEEKPDGNDWWAEVVGAYTAWNISEGLTNPIKVGVIDNGFDLEHEDFKMSDGHSKLQLITNKERNIPADHGTHVSGLIGAANNSLGIRGIADQAKLVCAKQLTISDAEEEFTTNEMMVTIKQMVDSDVSIINNSWGLERIQTPEKYLNEILEEYKKDAPSYNNKMNYKRILISFIQGMKDIDQKLDEINLATLRRYNKKYRLYDSYYNLCVSRSKSTAMECMVMIIELMINTKDRFLIIQAAGNGYITQNEDDDIKGGYDTSLSGYFCNITEDTYNLLPEKTRSSFQSKGISFKSIKNHILIVSGTTIDTLDGNCCLNPQFNYGDNVDICAPGGDTNNKIYSTVTTKDDYLDEKDLHKLNGKIYGGMLGTSMAAPIVSGSAALVWSIDPNLSAADVKNYLINNSTKAISTASGDNRGEYPMLNIGMAVKKLLKDLNEPILEETMDVQIVYKNFLFEGEYWEQVREYDQLEYAIMDITGDDTPELILRKTKEDESDIFFYRYDDASKKVLYITNINSQKDKIYRQNSLFYTKNSNKLATFVHYSDFETYSYYTLDESGLTFSNYMGFLDDKSDPDNYITYYRKWTDESDIETFAISHWDNKGEEDKARKLFAEQLDDLKEIQFSDISTIEEIKKDTISQFIESINVYFDHGYDDGKEFGVFTAVNNMGNHIWEIKTEKYDGAELDYISEIGVHNNIYYYVENGVIIAVELLTGKVLWKNKDFGGSLSAWTFDNEGTLYVSGFYNPDLFVISSTGSTVKRINNFDDEYFGPYFISLQEDKLTITYEGYPSESTGSVEVDVKYYTYSLR